MLSYELTNKEYQPNLKDTIKDIHECFHMNLQIRNINGTEKKRTCVWNVVLSYELTNKEYQLITQNKTDFLTLVLSYELTNK